MAVGILSLASVLTGCARQYDAVRIGPDLYETTASASVIRGHEGWARTHALQEANRTCAKQGQVVDVVRIDREVPLWAKVTVTFRCRQP